MINSWFSLFLDSGTQGLEALQGNTGPQRPAQKFDFQRILDTYRDESEVAVPTPLAGGEGTTSALLPPMAGAGHFDGQLRELIRSFSTANAQKPTVPLATPSPETITAILTGLTNDRYTIPLPGVTLQDLLLHADAAGASTEIEHTSELPETGEPAAGDSPHTVLLAFDRQALTGFLSSSTVPRERVDIPVTLTVQPEMATPDEAPVPEISGRLTLMPEGQQAFRKILTGGGITGDVTAALESGPFSAAEPLHLETTTASLALEPESASTATPSHPETTTVSLDAVSSVVAPVYSPGTGEHFELIIPTRAWTPESGRSRVLIHAHTPGYLPEPAALDADDPDTLDALMQRMAYHLAVRSSGDRAGVPSKEIGDPSAGAATRALPSAATSVQSAGIVGAQYVEAHTTGTQLHPETSAAGKTDAALSNSVTDVQQTGLEMPGEALVDRVIEAPVGESHTHQVSLTVTGQWRLPESHAAGVTDTTVFDYSTDDRHVMLEVPVVISGLQFDTSAVVPEKPALILAMPVDILDSLLSEAPSPVAGHLILKPATDQPASLTGAITMESVSAPLLAFLESSAAQDAPVIPVTIQRTENPADSQVPADKSVINTIAVTVSFSPDAPVQPPTSEAELPVYHITKRQDGSFEVRLPDGSPAILLDRNAYPVPSQTMSVRTDEPAAPAALPVIHVLEALQELQSSADQQISLAATTTESGAGVPSIATDRPEALHPAMQSAEQAQSDLPDNISITMGPIPSDGTDLRMDAMDDMDVLQEKRIPVATTESGPTELQYIARTDVQPAPAPIDIPKTPTSTAAPDRPAPGHEESAQQTGSTWSSAGRALRGEAPPAHHTSEPPPSAAQPHHGIEQPDNADGVKTEPSVPALFEAAAEVDQERQAPRTSVKAAKTSVVITYRPARSLQTQTLRATFTTDPPAQQAPAQSAESLARVHDGPETPLPLQQTTPVPHAPAAESALTATGDAVTVQLDAFSGQSQTSMGQRQDSQMPASGAATPDGTFAERLRVSDALIEQNVQRITHQARLMMEEGRSEIRMRLDPPHLGRLSLRMTLENGQIHGRILVERQEAQRLLQDAIPALRQTLHAQGVDVQTMDVQLRDHGSATDPNGRFVQPDAQRDDSQSEWERNRQEDTPEWKQFRKRRDGYRGQKFEQFA